MAQQREHHDRDRRRQAAHEDAIDAPAQSAQADPPEQRRRLHGHHRQAAYGQTDSGGAYAEAALRANALRTTAAALASELRVASRPAEGLPEIGEDRQSGQNQRCHRQELGDPPALLLGDRHDRGERLHQPDEVEAGHFLNYTTIVVRLPRVFLDHG